VESTGSPRAFAPFWPEAEAGNSAYEHCARIVAEVAASELSVQRFVRDVRGTLRVSVPQAFGRMCFVPLLPEYLPLTLMSRSNSRSAINLWIWSDS
jgi:DNA-binding transcriptional LysR family regulator